MSLSRVEAFSESVFGVAFTLLVLDFRPPESTAGLLRYVLTLWPQFLGYCVSFLLVGLVWANHRAMFLHVGTVDRMFVFLNTLLLADVAFLPFPTSVLARAISSRQGLTEATILYGVVLTVGGVFFNLLWHHANRGEHFRQGKGVSSHVRAISLRFGIGPAAYLVATLCAFLSPYLSMALYVALIVYFWFPGRSEQPSHE